MPANVLEPVAFGPPVVHAAQDWSAHVGPGSPIPKFWLMPVSAYAYQLPIRPPMLQMSASHEKKLSMTVDAALPHVFSEPELDVELVELVELVVLVVVVVELV